jgi:recombination protein RecT
MTPPQERLRTQLARRSTLTLAEQEAAKGDSPPVSVADMLDRLGPTLDAALPNVGMTRERIARLALTTINGNRDLMSCTYPSLAEAIVRAATLGLEIGGPLQHAHLVPFKGKATLVIGYPGMAELFWRHPRAAHLDAQPVFKGDDFDYRYGSDPFLHHKPQLDNNWDRKDDVIAWYAVAGIEGGQAKFHVSGPVEVARHRTLSKLPNSTAWKDHYVATARKVPLRIIFNLMPKSIELARALAWDGQPATGDTIGDLDAVPPFDGDVIDGEVEAETEDVGPHRFAGEDPAEPCPACGKSVDDDIHEQKASN